MSLASLPSGRLAFHVFNSFVRPIRENNKSLDKTFIYSYNGNGDITKVESYPYTTGDVSGTPTTVNYTYSGDRLTKYKYKSISYNSIGYPITYGDRTFVWTDGKLTRMCDDIDDVSDYSAEDISFTYNAYGHRIAKSYNYDPGADYSGNFTIGINTTYTYDESGRLIREYSVEHFSESANVTRELVYLYDESGMIGVLYSRNGASLQPYYYRRNAQGDVIAIYDANGNRKAEYAYDAWGNCKLIYEATGSDIGSINPIRYRGYYYDRETKLYYLNARYYNPEWRRFISPDDTGYINPETPNGLNLYAYCNNDPVNYSDNLGRFPLPIEIITNAISLPLDLYEEFLKISLNSLKNAPGITMEAAKKIARKGGHVQSARQIMRNQQVILSATKNTLNGFEKANKVLGKSLLIADIAWSLGENLLSGEESWFTDTIIDASLSLAIYGLSFLPYGFLISLTATAITIIFENEIEKIKDEFYDEWNSFFGVLL